MNILLISSGFILAFIIALCYEYKIRRTKPRNKVHFYVARNKDKTLCLYLGKPIRNEVSKSFTSIECRGLVTTWRKFKYLGLNIDDYKNLKWEDEPIEAFINIEE